MSRKLIDITGMTFGEWTVLRYCPALSTKERHFWEARCGCGATAILRGDSLRSGGTNQCAACSLERLHSARRERSHGLCKTPAYKSWSAMNDRCLSRINRADYSGRGITVCAAWRSFEKFLSDMGPRPRGTTLDRIDVNGNYEPGNCRWASAKTQNRNRRNTPIVTALGRSAPLTEWAEMTGILSVTIRGRLRAGWSHHDAVTLPRYERPQTRVQA
jgi:hypothetical protein